MYIIIRYKTLYYTVIIIIIISVEYRRRTEYYRKHGLGDAGLDPHVRSH